MNMYAAVCRENKSSGARYGSTSILQFSRRWRIAIRRRNWALDTFSYQLLRIPRRPTLENVFLFSVFRFPQEEEDPLFFLNLLKIFPSLSRSLGAVAAAVAGGHVRMCVSATSCTFVRSDAFAVQSSLNLHNNIAYATQLERSKHRFELRTWNFSPVSLPQHKL